MKKEKKKKVIEVKVGKEKPLTIEYRMEKYFRYHKDCKELYKGEDGNIYTDNTRLIKKNIKYKTIKHNG